MKASLTIAMDNAAFARNPHLELAHIFTDLAARILREPPMEAGDRIRLHDANGNGVGQLEILED